MAAGAPTLSDVLAGASLIAAAASGDVAEVERILLRTSPNVRQQSNGNTPLHIATNAMHRSLAQVLIKAGADCNAQNREGNSPLHNAAIIASLSMCELLLAHGADTNICNAEGDTPLHFNAYSGNANITALLFRHAARQTRNRGKYPVDLCKQQDRMKAILLQDFAEGEERRIEEERKREHEQEVRKRQAEEDLQKRKEELLERKKRAEEEREKKRKLADLDRRRKEEERERKKRLDDEARRKRDEEQRRRKREEEESRRRGEGDDGIAGNNKDSRMGGRAAGIELSASQLEFVRESRGNEKEHRRTNRKKRRQTLRELEKYAIQILLEREERGRTTSELGGTQESILPGGHPIDGENVVNVSGFVAVDEKLSEETTEKDDADVTGALAGRTLLALPSQSAIEANPAFRSLVSGDSRRSRVLSRDLSLLITAAEASGLAEISGDYDPLADSFRKRPRPGPKAPPRTVSLSGSRTNLHAASASASDSKISEGADEEEESVLGPSLPREQPSQYLLCRLSCFLASGIFVFHSVPTAPPRPDERPSIYLFSALVVEQILPLQNYETLRVDFPDPPAQQWRGSGSLKRFSELHDMFQPPAAVTATASVASAGTAGSLGRDADGSNSSREQKMAEVPPCGDSVATESLDGDLSVEPVLPAPPSGVDIAITQSSVPLAVMAAGIDGKENFAEEKERRKREAASRRKEADEKRRREEQERKQRGDELRRQKETDEKRRREEQERKQRGDELRRQKETDEKRRREEQERKQRGVELRRQKEDRARKEAGDKRKKRKDKGRPSVSGSEPMRRFPSFLAKAEDLPEPPPIEASLAKAIRPADSLPDFEAAEGTASKEKEACGAVASPAKPKTESPMTAEPLRRRAPPTPVRVSSAPNLLVGREKENTSETASTTPTGPAGLCGSRTVPAAPESLRHRPAPRSMSRRPSREFQGRDGAKPRLPPRSASTASFFQEGRQVSDLGRPRKGPATSAHLDYYHPSRRNPSVVSQPVRNVSGTGRPAVSVVDRKDAAGKAEDDDRGIRTSTSSGLSGRACGPADERKASVQGRSVEVDTKPVPGARLQAIVTATASGPASPPPADPAGLPAPGARAGAPAALDGCAREGVGRKVVAPASVKSAQAGASSGSAHAARIRAATVVQAPPMLATAARPRTVITRRMTTSDFVPNLSRVSPNPPGSRKVYPLNVLLTRPLPDDVVPTELESHLSPDQFTTVFKMEFFEFAKLPRWKQLLLKKKVKMF